MTWSVRNAGVDYLHPDLGGCAGAGCRVAYGYDFANMDGDPRDTCIGANNYLHAALDRCVTFGPLDQAAATRPAWA